ncbi:MAG: peptide-methionine (S)-S-oxide reductase MsrA [Gammaproteobacteria bacterium]|nr:peptide-methionine (S)-S-oxide reductase MsrA [Gammaproteobacteria bacterium]
MKQLTLLPPDACLVGRDTPISQLGTHMVTGHNIEPPWPEPHQIAWFGMGCFWGAERLFWEIDGVLSTAVGYGGGITKNPTYEELCSGRTNHAELVQVVYNPERVSYTQLLEAFWNEHDPTQCMRQGNDLGTQYRSVIWWADDEQRVLAEASRVQMQQKLNAMGYPTVTTDIAPAAPFYYAERYHQQYLHKNPAGYCGLAGTGACYRPESPSQ